MRAGISRLDLKLGVRMLVKYPGLTLVGGLAIAFAIAVGAAAFEVASQLTHPTLPLHEGDRVVAIRSRDGGFATWRRELDSVEEIGASRTLQRNLITADGRVEPVQVAEISASAFRLARVPPLLGRFLVEADERAGAPPVVVIGHDVWRTRFGGDRRVVGRTLRLGRSRSTVVGVMPEGFAFPVAHGVWVPLRAGVPDPERGGGPEIQVFGRLAPGATPGEAREELAALGAGFEVLPYAEAAFPVVIDEGLRAGMYSVVLFLVVFLAIACANVATLVFARTAAREREIVVRTALGASRGRIVTQLFAEGLVLAGVAALAGLAAADLGLKWGMSVLDGEVEAPLPFWLSASLSPATVLYVGGLAVLGAVIVGVLPALRLTGRGVEPRLRQAAVGGPGPGLGGVWTRMIVIQVAVTVILPALAYFTRQDGVHRRSLDVGVAEERFLSARLEMDRDAPGDTSRAAFLARFRASYRELERRLAAEPAVAGAAFADRLPRMDHPQRRIQVDGGAAAPESSTGPCRDPARVQWDCVSSASVDLDYLDVMGAPVLAGRAFRSADAEPGGRVVIVNRSFVRQVLGGRTPIGRRVRYLEPEDPDAARPPDWKPGPWHEIVGVAGDLGMTDGSDPGESGAGLYHPVTPGAAFPVHVAVRVTGDPESFAPRLRGVAAAVDPGLRLHSLMPLDQRQRGSLATIGFWLRLVVLASSVALLLSLAGIYSVMSYTVARRTREIGIRSALGADRRRIVAAVLPRSLAQVVLGVMVGGAVTVALALAVNGVISARGAVLIVAHLAATAGACLLGCVAPLRRALRIEPTEALRAEG